MIESVSRRASGSLLVETIECELPKSEHLSDGIR
jgi:hypothetical protein